MQFLRFIATCWFVLGLFAGIAHADDPMAKPKDAVARDHRDGQVVSLTLTPKQQNVASKPPAIETGKPAPKPAGGSKTRPSTATRPSGSNASKPGFDPNEVGGD